MPIYLSPLDRLGKTSISISLYEINNSSIFFSVVGITTLCSIYLNFKLSVVSAWGCLSADFIGGYGLLGDDLPNSAIISLGGSNKWFPVGIPMGKFEGKFYTNG